MTAMLAAALAGCTDDPAGAERNPCPGVRPIPTELAYDCDASTPDAGTCEGTFSLAGRTWGDGGRFAVGCRAYLPMREVPCVGQCCGPQLCYCSTQPGAPAFVCPL
jgi:hypothetical protein